MPVAKRKPGPPKDPRALRRGRSIQVAVPVVDYDRYTARARSRGLTLPAYVRELLDRDRETGALG